MFKVNNKIIRSRHWRRSGVFSVNFGHISHLFPGFSIVDFEQVNVGWNHPANFTYTVIGDLIKEMPYRFN